MWLVPPIMNSQITLLALGTWWGLPSGGVRSSSAKPSRLSIVARASEPNPKPMSYRNRRRVRAFMAATLSFRSRLASRFLSADRYEIVVVHEHVDQVFAGPHRRVVRCLDLGFRVGLEQ